MQRAETRSAVFGLRHLVPGTPQQLDDEVADVGIVVDDEDPSNVPIETVRGFGYRYTGS